MGDKNNKPRLGENHHRAKLTDHEVELLRQMVANGELSVPQAAEKFDICKRYAYRLVDCSRR